MLVGVSPLLSPALLATLYQMGHGDEIVLADAHFIAPVGSTIRLLQVGNPWAIDVGRRRSFDGASLVRYCRELKV